MCGGRLGDPTRVADVTSAPWNLYFALARFKRGASTEGAPVPVLQSNRLQSGSSLQRTKASTGVQIGDGCVSSTRREVLRSFDTGKWFEYLVAAAFKAAGADEVCVTFGGIGTRTLLLATAERHVLRLIAPSSTSAWASVGPCLR
jgi:hypothetical protein